MLSIRAHNNYAYDCFDPVNYTLLHAQCSFLMHTNKSNGLHMNMHFLNLLCNSEQLDSNRYIIHAFVYSRCIVRHLSWPEPGTDYFRPIKLP